MKTILAFETSHPALSVALGTADGRVRELGTGVRFQHSEHLISLIRRLLRKNRLRFEQIDALALDRGPGSFTGLRIGFSLLKGFLAGRKRPCYGALSLDMIAGKLLRPEGSRLGVLVDARRERIYTRFYSRRNHTWRPEKRAELLSLPELSRRLTAGAVLTGDALARYGEALRKAVPFPLVFLEGPRTAPSAKTLVEWFQKKDPRLVRLNTSRDFLPLYFRASEAEEKKKEAAKHYGR